MVHDSLKVSIITVVLNNVQHIENCINSVLNQTYGNYGNIEYIIIDGGSTDGTIDLNMEIWPQNKMGWYDEQIARGTIADLGPTFSSGPQFFMISRWMAEQYHIQTISI